MDESGVELSLGDGLLDGLVVSVGEGVGVGVGVGVGLSDGDALTAAVVRRIAATEPVKVAVGEPAAGCGDVFALLTVAAGGTIPGDELSVGVVEGWLLPPPPPPPSPIMAGSIPAPAAGSGSVGQRYGLEARLKPVIAAAANAPTAINRDVGTVWRHATSRCSTDVEAGGSRS